ncbi:MAG: methylated-DNA--[protein]-cysteine S-methyltransferase [Gaiellales bacterium]
MAARARPPGVAAGAYTTVESPVGRLLLVATDAGLTGLHMPPARGTPSLGAGWMRTGTPFRDALEQLRAYFAGRLTRFDLRLAPAGTPFQQSVWRELLRIPYGRTVTYGELAGRIGHPTAARAVGAANGANPISIVIPCHRVVGSGGALTGYGGGLDRKRALLALEAQAAAR